MKSIARQATKIKNSLKTLSKLHACYNKALKHVEGEINRLLDVGTEHGKPHWKKDKHDKYFLRIVRPATITEKRSFIYIGSKPEKIAEAFAAINRHEQLLKLYEFEYELNSVTRINEASLIRYHESISTLIESNRNGMHVAYKAIETKADITGNIEQMDINHVRPIHFVQQ